MSKTCTGSSHGEYGMEPASSSPVAGLKMSRDDSPTSFKDLPCILYLRAEVAPVAVFHDDAQVVLARGEEGVLVADDVRVVQSPKELHLSVAVVFVMHGQHRRTRNR